MHNIFYIDESYRVFIDDCKEKNILGMHDLELKDIFLLAVALGLNHPEDIDGKKFGFFRESYIKTSDLALFASILLGKPENKDDVDRYANADINYDESERCAEAGFKKLKTFIEDTGGDSDLITKKALLQLNMLYEQNVASGL